MTRLRIGAGALSGAGQVLVISPHLDDGVLSCGCLVAGLARRRRVAVATVFAGRPRCSCPLTEWDRAAGFTPGSDVIGARRREDRRALDILGARAVWLPFRDGQYGKSPPVDAVARRLAELPMLREASDPARALVLFPLGLFHSDHHLAREAAVRIMRTQKIQATWLAYEDALYRRVPGLIDRAVARLRRAGLAPRRLRVAAEAGAVRRKTLAVRCYRSQLRALATPGRPGHDDAFADERFWQVSRARSWHACAAPAGMSA
jgi:LmbE family N-acetylglucosaminyl deacetylase